MTTPNVTESRTLCTLSIPCIPNIVVNFNMSLYMLHWAELLLHNNPSACHAGIVTKLLVPSCSRITSFSNQ